MPHRTRLLIAVLLVLSACGQSAPSDEGASSVRVRTDASASASASPAPSQPLPPRPEATVRLATFESCSDFLGHVQQEALEHVGPHGIQDGRIVFATDRALAATAGAESGSAASGGRAAATYSQTNVQVEGVDEPDIVKTDGRRIFAVAGQHLHALSVSEGAAELEASVPLEGWSQELLLDGDRVLLISGGGGIEPAFSSHPVGGGETVVVVFDVSDGIREVSRTTLEGSYVSARMVDGVVRIVLASRSDRLEFVTPQGEGDVDVDEAVRRNREIIESSSAEDWIPDYVLRTPRGTQRGELSTCSTVHHPAEFSGFGMTTVVTIDPAAPVPRESAAVLGDASTVYASPESLYVASMAWPSSPTADVAPEDVLTQIHRFDITGAQASYVASGEVAGSLLNQFSLDEHEGRLRVATTTGFRWEETSQSGVTILETSGAALVPVGAVAGLGLGERIYAVRFMGDLGYVVTFRQIDPLYVLDLSDPRDPRNVGELKIPGYSAYLHPISDDRLLGVGQDATEEGRPMGSQVSLFDVADPTRPTRLDTVSFDQGHSSVEFDHRAFLYWAPSDLAVIPLQIWGEQAPAFSGVVGVGVGDGLRELGRLSHDADGEDAHAGAILRSLVIGDRLFTVSELGIGWADLATFEARGFADFPRPEPPSPEPRPTPEDDGEDDDATPAPLPNPGL